MLFEERGTFGGTFSANICPDMANSKSTKYRDLRGFMAILAVSSNPAVSTMPFSGL